MVVAAEQAAAANHAKKIKEINIELGELSGMLPEFFEKYYDIVIERHELLHGSKLNIRLIPGEGLCCDCHTLYNVFANEGACPKCGSRSKTILSGRDLILKEIIVEEV